jgi:diaminopimelate epimerase
MMLRFTKMHGAGNDYLYINGFSDPLPRDASDAARRMSDRRFGIGADGLVLMLPSERADVRMRMFNSDGSEAEMCGNAVRCVAKFVRDRGICSRDELTIETGNGVLTLQCFGSGGKVDRVRVDMGPPIFEADRIPTTLPGNPPIGARLEVAGKSLDVTCVSMGNPHCITFVDEITDEWVLGVGPKIEVHPAFPRKVNAEFIQVLNRSEFNMRVWERGSGETWACGTGASAAAVACILNGFTGRTVTAHLRGGDLLLEWPEDGHVFMTGPAVEVFTGEWCE